MNRTIPLATIILLAATVAASAQAIGQYGGVMGPTSVNMDATNSFANGIMNGQGASAGSMSVHLVASTSGGRIAAGGEDRSAARDGCINYPNMAHNSADCSQIISWDPAWVVPDKPLSEMTGAEENMVRSYNILVKNKTNNR